MKRYQLDNDTVDWGRLRTDAMLQGDKFTLDCGWVHRPDEVKRILATLPYPRFADAALMSSPFGENRDTFLWEFSRKVYGKDLPSGPQKIGDCVSWGWTGCRNLVACMQIANGALEAFEEGCTEATYALSRVQVGGQKGSYEDGSVGAWAAKAATDYGTLSRMDLKRSNLPPDYDGDRAKKWGASGLPDNLLPLAKNHLIKTVSLVKTFEEAAEAIMRGYPVAVCSQQGFTMTRDSDGFCTPQGTWAHCMHFIAVRFDKPALCCAQSWGPNTPDGPTALDQPTNTFWVEANVCDRMLGMGDSFTMSQFVGYPAQDVVINWHHSRRHKR